MFQLIANKLSLLPSGPKQLIIAAADAAALTVALMLSLMISGLGVMGHGELTLLGLMLAGPMVALASLRFLGVHRVVTRYLGIELVERCFYACIVAGLSVSALLVVIQSGRSSIEVGFLFGLLSFTATLLMRVGALKLLRQRVRRRETRRAVLIYGAGDAGSQLAAALRDGCDFMPVAFVDDSKCRQGRTIRGISVFAPEQLEQLKQRFGFERVLLAVPSASRDRRRQILERVEQLAVKVLAVPSLADMAVGSLRVDDLREVQIEDLLARDPVPAVPELLTARIAGKVVLITGAGGSIGSELARQALSLGAKRLVLLDLSEYALYAIDRELRLKPDSAFCELVPVLGSVLDQGLLDRVFRQHGIQTVYHAAAYKHVPLVEANLLAAVVNNVHGTLLTVRAAITASVECFVLVSTDKAVRPTNVMGASKRVCELIVQGLSQAHPEIAMSLVRFGNVLGSSGSVVPLFREQIAAGGPVTVTHPEVTRYFMTIPEAAQLVIQAGGMGQSGEVFVLEMGEPVRILQLAERMIHLSGLTVKSSETPNGDIDIKFSGLRPGEKLYEELLISDFPLPTGHSRIFKARESCLSWPDLKVRLAKMDEVVAQHDEAALLTLLETLVSGFSRRTVVAVDQRVPRDWQQVASSSVVRQEEKPSATRPAPKSAPAVLALSRSSG